jgi:L-amino acid N-acyltransferase YncA
VRPATRLDAEQIAAMYNYYIAHTVVTFEEEAVTAAEMAARVERITPTHPWLVCETQGEPQDRIVGYAYAAPWHSRRAYRLTAETTVYVASDRQRHGVGTALYCALLDGLRQRKFNCAIGAVALPNAASVALHERFGFGKVGQFAAVGWKFGRWIDVGYWQLML